jgi:hypothetical protein
MFSLHSSDKYRTCIPVGQLSHVLRHRTLTPMVRTPVNRQARCRCLCESPYPMSHLSGS